MNQKVKSFLWPLLFTLCGALAGYAYYYFVGCISGVCSITSNPFRSTLYMALFGWLLSVVLKKEDKDKCNT